MNKLSNYLLLFFISAGFLFLASCGEDTENPTPSTISITLSDTVIAASPGDTVTIGATLGGVNNDVEATVTSNPAGEFVDDDNMITSGEEVSFVIPITAEPGNTFTLTFSVNDGNAQANKQASIIVAFENIVEVATSDEDFSILATALQNADLISTLEDSETQFTVFAPTNAAFNALGITEDNVDDFDLTSILQYHVISGTAALSEDLTTGDLETVAGNNIYINTEGGVSVNGVSVATADLAALNGVVHVVESVLAPTTFTTVLLAPPLGSKASETFFSTLTGETYSVNDVNGSDAPISAFVDFGYFYGVTSEASIISPDDYPTEAYNVEAEGWTSIRNTDFRTTSITAAQFDAINASASPSSVSEGFDTGTDTDNTARVTNLEVDQVVAFRTEAGRFGLFKVAAIEPGDESNDSITLDVKMTN